MQNILILGRLFYFAIQELESNSLVICKHTVKHVFQG